MADNEFPTGGSTYRTLELKGALKSLVCISSQPRHLPIVLSGTYPGRGSSRQQRAQQEQRGTHLEHYAAGAGAPSGRSLEARGGGEGAQPARRARGGRTAGSQSGRASAAGG